MDHKLNHAEIKLFRFGNFENEKPAVEYPDGTRFDVSEFGEDFNEQFFASDGVKRLQSWLEINGHKCNEIAKNSRFGSCVARPSKIVAIGLNYIDHITETGGSATLTSREREPVIFLKATTCLCGPFDNVIIPKNSEKLDWEAELAIVISKRASYISESEAVNHVAGYSIMNDYSERAWQLEKSGRQWDKGKGCDTFGPLGPYLVLPQNVGNPQALNISLTVNGELMQSSNTKNMIFSIPHLISYTSHFMTLLPGDVIITGTPAGVGLGRTPQQFLKEGDVVETYIENVGIQRQIVAKS